MSDPSRDTDRYGELPYDELLDVDGEQIPLVDIDDVDLTPAS